MKKLYQKEKGAFPDPILNLTWEYGEKDEHGKVKHLDVNKVAMEINGYYLEDVYDKKADPPKLIGRKGDLVPNFVSLRDDGSTSSGNWLYCGSYTLKDGKVVNMMARRGKEDPTGLGLYPNWAWAWPLNRRIIYNRASVDPNGNPWDPNRPVLKWNPADPATGKPGGWVGDIPDGPAPPLANDKEGKLPFIMKPLGVGSIFGKDLGDGPFPEHYEPLECPVPENPMSKRHRVNPTIPVAKLQAMAKDPTFLFSFDYARYPYVATTYRVSEKHWQTGVMTRHLPWLLEMAAPDVRRDEQGTGGGKRDPERRPGCGDLRQGAGLVCRHRDGPVQILPDHGHHGPSGRDAVVFRVAASRRRQRGGQRQSPGALHGRSQHLDTGIEGLHGQHQQACRTAGHENHEERGEVTGMPGKSFFIDTTRCTGCRGCQVACKQWNRNPGTKTSQRGTYQNPRIFRPPPSSW